MFVNIHVVFGFSEPKWNPTFVLLMKERPIKRRGHPHYKEWPHPLKGGDLTHTGTEELKSTSSMKFDHMI